MSVPRVAVVPVGRMDVAEIEGALGRVAKVLHAPVELREAAPLPRGTEDPARGQHRAQPLLQALRADLVRLKTTKVAGADGVVAPAPPGPPHSTVAVFVTDVDLFTPATDAVFADVDAAHKVAIVSIRRMREVFYRRKSEPAKHRARLVKEVLHAVGRVAGLAACGDPGCALAPSRSIADVDRKSEHYCAACWKWMSAGSMRI